MIEAPDTQTTSSLPLPRRHEIDALRSIALLLLILYHAFCAFQPFAPLLQFIGYSRSLGDAWVIAEALNPWRIPVLFLISGVTTGYLLQNRPVGRLLPARLMRLVPPLAITFFGIAAISPALFQAFHGNPIDYTTGPAHLWFVWNLVVYFIFGAPALIYIKQRPNGLIIRIVRRLSPFGWLLVLPALLTATTWFLEPHITPELYSVHFLRFWSGFACFLSGVVLVTLGDDFWRGIRRVCHLALPAAVMLYILRMTEFDFGSTWTSLAARSTESVCGMFAFLGYGSLAFSRPSARFSALNRSVFAIYIVHMPIQQAVAFFLFRMDANPWLVFGIHASATLIISGLIYTLLLRPMPWLHPFFGIAPRKDTPARATQPVEAPPASRPAATVARAMILYVLTPLIVLVTIWVLAGAEAEGATEQAMLDSDPHRTASISVPTR